MHFNWNKRVLASSFAVFTMATSLNAIPKGPCDRPAEEVCCDNPKPGPFAFAYPMDLGLSCPRDFYIHLDGLALQAKQDGMEFAIQDDTGMATPPIQYGKVQGFADKSGSWDYNPGLRFGFGFFLDHDCWSVDFNWTWVNITNYAHGNATNSTGTSIPLWMLGSDDQGGIESNREANAVWKASYNIIDLSLGKPYHVSRYVVFNPFFGIRGGYIDQHFSARYQGNPGTNAGGTVHHGDNDFRGVGLRLGINTDWIVGKGWNLFANISSSLLASKFEVSQNMTFTGAQAANEGFDIKSDQYQNAANFELAVGIAWSKYFDRNKYRIGLRAAYEFAEWFNQLRMRKFFSGAPGYASDTVSGGDLSLNGFSLRLQLDI